MKKILSIFLSIIITFSLNANFYAVNAVAPEDTNVTPEITLESLQEEYNRLETEIVQGDSVIKSLEKLDNDYLVIDAINVQSGKISEQIENIQKQKEIIEPQIETLKTDIANTETELEKMQVQITKLDNQINDLVERYCQRLRTKYIYGDITFFNLLDKNDNISSLINNAEFVSRLLKQDEDMIKALKDDMETIEKTKNALIEKQISLGFAKSELEKIQKTLSDNEILLKEKQEKVTKKSEEINEKLRNAEVFSNIINIDKDSYVTGMEFSDNKLNENFSASNANIDTSGEAWMWPVPYDNSYISSPYGYRSDPISGKYKFHAGIDITMGGAQGKKLIAVKSGVVSRIEYESGGYGKYVIVDHGNGFASLYAHCSVITVSEGQTVKQGQQVAKIGSTGYSTGPHVHFEIRKNGEKVNPMNYLTR